MVIASTHALQPQGVAWNAIAREAIRADPAWQGGHYDGTGRKPDAGMGVARMIGHVTYLSGQALDDKFAPAAAGPPTTSATRSPSRSSRSRATCATRPTRSCKRFDANTYLYTSRALTYFDLAREHGGGSLERGARRASRRARC